MQSYIASILCIGLVLSCAFEVSPARASTNLEPLFAAIRSGNVQNVQQLIRNQNLNVANRRGLTPLSVAVETDNDRIVSLLIQNGAYANFTKGILKTAVEHGNEKVVEVLTQNGVDVNTYDFLGETPLQLAAYKGLEKIVDLLIKSGANVNYGDVSGKTALHQAAGFGREKVADLLIKNGADVNKKDKQGKTALHLAAEHGHATVVDLLRRNGADINIVDNSGRTPAESAAILTRLISSRYPLVLPPLMTDRSLVQGFHYAMSLV